MARKNKREAALDLPAKVKAYFRARAIGRGSYERADRLLAEIVAVVKPGVAIPLNDSGKCAVLMDLYDGKLVVFRAHGIRRFELQVVK
jgi:hypothetical protein